MNLRPFEIILIAIFSIAALGGLFTLSIYKGGDTAEETQYGASVSIWGTVDAGAMTAILSDIATVDKGFNVVSYKKIDERSFENELLNAIAEGNSPDLILMPHTMLASYRSKLTSIPYETLPERTFKDTYIDGAGIFMMSDGIYGIPIAVDPLVMYFNRTLLSNAGLATPPKTWESLLLDGIPALTRTDERYTLSQSAIGMGEFINIKHAKDILSLLFLQAGTSLVEEINDEYRITINTTPGGGMPPAQSAVAFYTQFAAPGSSAYTWNRSRPLDRGAFTGGTLALYLGFGSERKDLEDANPNLDFDIAPVPQSQGATAQRNFGTFYALAIPKASRNQSGAYRVAMRLGVAETSNEIVNKLDLTPVHRSLYSGPTTDSYTTILRQAGLIARGWLDPSPRDSENVFKNMVEDVTSGRREIEAVINEAAYSLEALFR